MASFKIIVMSIKPHSKLKHFLNKWVFQQNPNNSITLRNFTIFIKWLCKDKDMIDCRQTNRCFVLLLLAKTDQGRQLPWRLSFFTYRWDHLLHIFFTPCHLTDAVSDKVVLVMKKQLFAKEMYLLQCHVIPSARRGGFHAFMLLY